jgi:hypothetical protein
LQREDSAVIPDYLIVTVDKAAWAAVFTTQVQVAQVVLHLTAVTHRISAAQVRAAVEARSVTDLAALVQDHFLSIQTLQVVVDQTQLAVVEAVDLV